jgi:hypothetical protein
MLPSSNNLPARQCYPLFKILTLLSPLFPPNAPWDLPAVCGKAGAFKSYVWSSIVASNLLTIARAKLVATRKYCLGPHLFVIAVKVRPKNEENV